MVEKGDFTAEIAKNTEIFQVNRKSRCIRLGSFEREEVSTFHIDNSTALHALLDGIPTVYLLLSNDPLSVF